MNEPSITRKPRLETLRGNKAFQAISKGAQLIGYRLFRLSGEMFAVVMGLGIAWLYGASFLLTQQSMDLSVMKPWAAQGFSQAFEGHEAEIEDLRLRWLPSEDRIALQVENIQVKDKQGEVLQSFPLLQSDFKSADALKFRPNPTHLELRGGTVTALIEAGGQLTVGLGTPETVGRFGPVFKGAKGTDEPRKLPEAFQQLHIHDGKIYIKNQETDMNLILNLDELVLEKSIESLALTVDGYIDQAQDPATIAFFAKTNADRTAVDVALQAEEVRFDELAPKSGRFKDLGRLAAPVDLVLEADFKRGESLRSALVDLSIGRGRVTGFDFAMPLNGFAFEGLLTPGEEELDVTAITLSSDRVSFDGIGKVTKLSALNDGDPFSSPYFDINLKTANLDVTPIFAAPFSWTDVKMAGSMDFDDRSLNLEKLEVTEDDYTASLNLYAKAEDGKPHEIRTKGAITGRFDAKDFVAIWPVNFATGGRDWIERSVFGGTISPLEFDINLDPGFFEAPALTPERYQLNFGLVNNDVRYISTMSPLLGVSGIGRIDGNTLTVDYQGGQVGGVTVEGGVITIPQLIPKGGDIILEGSGYGSAADMMSIINQKPFQFADKYGVDPLKIGGQGRAEAKITRPLLVHFDEDRIEYEISGDFTDAVAPFKVGQFPVHDGQVKLTGDKTGVHITGPAKVGPWPAQIEWHEYLGTDTRPTEYKLSGKMDHDVLDEFGLGLRQYFDGEIDVNIQAFGPMEPDLANQAAIMAIDSGTVDIDLTNAELAYGEVWSKSSGEAGKATMNIALTADQTLRVSDVNVAAPGLNMAGSLDLAKNLRLIGLDLTSVKVDGLIDAALQLKPDNTQQKLSLFIEGDYLDVSPWMNTALNSRSSGLDIPLLMTSSVKSLYLKPDYIVNDARILFSHTGQSVSDFRLGGRTADGALAAEITSDAVTGNRLLTLSLPEASKAAKSFLGLESTRKGKLELRAKLPPVDEIGAIVGQAEVTDFYMQKTPFLAQILSLASLTGMSDMLGGEGLRFVKMEVPFTLTKDELKVRDARLVGPVLGMTGDGDISLSTRTLDFDGTLVPAYTANNILGDIPLIGDILVGKKGSGMFALTYTVKGPFEKTQISVNPLSALAPGFLKGIFKSDKKGLSDEVLAEIEAVKPKAPEE